MQDDPVPPKATLVVCTTCRRAGEVPLSDERPGAAFHAALAAETLPPGVTLRAVECLSVCSNGCAVALTAPGKWSYVYGGLDPATHLADVLRGAALYAAAPDGLVVWRDRPEVFRKQSVARVPPLEVPHEP
jgi:predicted metal-binding protein